MCVCARLERERESELTGGREDMVADLEVEEEDEEDAAEARNWMEEEEEDRLMECERVRSDPERVVHTPYICIFI